MAVRTSSGAIVRSARAGFTLVEMLVVITIIGMLMALLSVAVWKALQRAKEAAIVAEIDQLTQGLQAYKERHRKYPPSMMLADLNTRKATFMRHLRTVYPSSVYGTATKNFDDLNEVVKQTYRVQAQEGQSGAVAADLLRLDQAEALVFWLGGFPTPLNDGGQPVANRRLFGFHKDADQPFKRSDRNLPSGVNPLDTRTQQLFDFKEDRLVDNDADGWWEYVPTSGTLVAPFVYFDAESYGSVDASGGIYGYPRYGDANAESAANNWGIAVPFAAFFDPGGKSPTRWQNPQSFQIVTGGLDGRYSVGMSANSMRIPVYPGGFTYVGPKYRNPPSAYSDEELDNLTSLGKTTLEAARSEALQ